MRLFPLLALPAIWCATAMPLAQERVEHPVLSVRTDLVTLPLSVIDRKGRYVTGLRQADFTVYDGGERREIQFFSGDDLPATVGLVVDSSGSMRTRREHVTAAAAAFAEMRHPLDEFFTVNFNEAVWLGLPPGVAFTGDMALVRAVLAAAPAQGMTALYDAVDRGLGHLQLGTRDRKALIVVSDGGDNASVQTLDAVVAHARRTNGVIYAVALADRSDREARPRVLRTLARETGGRVLEPDDPADVSVSFSEIVRELRSGYTIGFLPAETIEGGFRTVRVVANARDGGQLIVRTRAGYYAPPSEQRVR